MGDACGENRSAFVLGSLEVVKAPSEGPSASQAGKALFEPRPVINHIFRQPEKRPPAALSYAFTGLALAPLAVLAYLLIELKANLKVRHAVLDSCRLVCVVAFDFVGRSLAGCQGFPYKGLLMPHDESHDS